MVESNQHSFSCARASAIFFAPMREPNQWSRAVSPTLIPFAGLKDKGITFSRMHLWRLERKGDFPKHVPVSANRIAWVESEIDAWIKARIAARGEARIAA